MNDDECDCEGFGLYPSSLIPNPSFEEMDCCPDDFDQMECATEWMNGNETSSEYFNLCDLYEIPFGDYAPAMLPLPDGNGFIGMTFSSLEGEPDWEYTESIGTHLESPLVAGTEYVLSLSLAWAKDTGIIDFAIYGTPDPSDLPWEGQYCPIGVGDWQVLANQIVTLTPDGSWQEITYIFTPTEDIYAISLCFACPEDVNNIGYIYG